MKALVLSGGGARGAYQAGVLKAIAEISQSMQKHSPFQIMTGISAGAINVGFLAAGCDDFLATSQKLTELWSNLKSDNVIKTDALSIGKLGFGWLGDLSFGNFKGVAPGRSLLETDPLWDLIRNNMDFSKIQTHIDSGILYAVGMTALDYQTSEAITFLQAHADAPSWRRTRRSSSRVNLAPEHIMASSAIPMLFPPIEAGGRFYGDGCVRNTTPCSPSLHLGASEILVIGVRKQIPTNTEKHATEGTSGKPSVARVINMILNAVLLDGIEVDLERLRRINEFMNRVPEELHSGLNFKPVRDLFISPSEDIGAIASKMASRLPRVIRYLLKGLGPLDDASEIISYLMFESDFTSLLAEMGYKDGMNRRSEIEEFLKPA